MNSINKYFDQLSSLQIEQLQKLDELYRHWNAQINVISRKDIDNLYIHHVLHSMTLAKVMQFKAGAKIMDLGTGGGFPGVPLAILFPETEFLLVDSIGKKVKVAAEVAKAIGLKNLRTKHSRAEEVKEKFDFVVTRAVAKAEKLVNWTRRCISDKHQHGIPNGIWAYKGLTNLAEELKALPKDCYTEVYPMKDYYEEEFFETKCLVYINF
jgi:16S rRNA (guanine527-N7)-methyltransferase